MKLFLAPDAHTKMQDALTESFCERCGTRFEFAAPARVTPITRTRGLVKGLKNYIMSQDSLSDALGDAMRSQSDELAAKQLDAFHSSFNFCIDCRQYTCTNCWNDAKGRCQSCQPLTEAEARAKRYEATFSQPAAEATPLELLRESPAADVDWPATDLTTPEQAPTPLITWDEPVALPEPEPVFFEPEPVVVEAEVEPESLAEPEPVFVEPELVVVETEVEPEPVAEPEPVSVEPEPVVVEAEVEPEPEPMWLEPEPVYAEAEAEPELEPIAEPEPVLFEAEAEPEPEPEYVEPEPVLVEPEPEPYRPLGPITDTFLHFPDSVPEREEVPSIAARAEPEPPSEADIETLAARRAQLDLLGLGDPGEGPVGPTRPNVIPYRSSGASARETARLAATAGRAFWDASAREVSGAVTEIGVRSCGHCELSISATARFCRRCGTPQAQSA